MTKPFQSIIYLHKDQEGESIGDIIDIRAFYGAFIFM